MNVDDFEANLLPFLRNHFPVTEANAKRIIDWLLPCKSMWSRVRLDLYTQIILNIGEAYNKLGDTDRAIHFLEEQIKEFSSLYSYGYGPLSDMYHHLGVYYAHILNGGKALDAFNEHICRFLIDNQMYSNLDCYSYRSCNEYTLADLENNTLTVANPKTFNDPMDCLIFPWFENNSQKIKNEGDRLAAEMLGKAYSYVKIRCFRRNKPLPSPEDIDPASRSWIGEQYEPLMWAHYADGHKGFCVKYEFPSRLTSVPLSQGICESEISRFGNVTYASAVNLEDSLSINDAFYKKSEQWEYECEVRLLHYDPTWKGDYKPIKLPSGCVKEVYFGLKCSEENKQRIRDALNGQQVELYDIINKDDDFYKLTSQRYESM